MRRLFPDSWYRVTPPVFHFPKRVRYLAGFLGFYSVGTTMLLCGYAENLGTALVLMPLGLAGLLLNILAFQEEKP